MDLGFRRAPSSAPLNKPPNQPNADIEDKRPVACQRGAGQSHRLVGGSPVRKRPPCVRSSGAGRCRNCRSTASELAILNDRHAPPRCKRRRKPRSLVHRPCPKPEARTCWPLSLWRPTLAPSAAHRWSKQPLVIKTDHPQKRPARTPSHYAGPPTLRGRPTGRQCWVATSRMPAEENPAKELCPEISTSERSLRKVVRRPQGDSRQLLGMTRRAADLACAAWSYRM